MKKWLFAVLLGAALVLGACGGSDDGANEEPAEDNTAEESNDGAVDTAAAEEIYESNCASCHGGDLSGGAGPDLTAVGAEYSADEIQDIIENGKGSMPAQEQVSEDDARTVAEWLAEKIGRAH